MGQDFKDWLEVFSYFSGLIYVLVGWALGIASGEILDWLRRRRTSRRLRRTVRKELETILPRLLDGAFSIRTKRGTFDKDFSKWYFSVSEKYPSMDHENEAREVRRKLQALTEEEMDMYLRGTRDSFTGSISIPKHDVPFVRSQISSLLLFNETETQRLLDICANIDILHHLVEESAHYFRKTFDGSMSNKNHEINDTNLLQAYDRIAARSENIVNKVKALLDTDLKA